MLPIQSIPYSQFSGEVLAASQPPFYAPNTYSKMASTLRSFEQHVNPKTTADLTTSAVIEFVKKRMEIDKVRVNTIRGDLSYLSAAFSYGCEQKRLESNPCMSRRARIRPEPPLEVPIHSLEQVYSVLEHLRQKAPLSWQDARLHAFATTVAYTGIRKSEALYLKPIDIDIEASILAISGRRRLKTVKSAAPIPMPPALVLVLREWLKQCGTEWVFPGNKQLSPWTSGGLGQRVLDHLKNAAEEVGVKNFTIRSLRHDYATHAESAWDLSELTLQRILRHTRPLTQRNYRHPEYTNLVRKVAGVSYQPR